MWKMVHMVGKPEHTWAYSVEFRPDRLSFGQPSGSPIPAQRRMTSIQ